MTASHCKDDGKDTVRRHTRVRRAVKIVGPWRVGVSLVFGVVATVLVAWWIALPSSKIPAYPINPNTTSLVQYMACSEPFANDPTKGAMVFWSRLGHVASCQTIVESSEFIERLERSESGDDDWRAYEDRPAWARGIPYAIKQADGKYTVAHIDETCSGFPFMCLSMRGIYAVEDRLQYRQQLQNTSGNVPRPEPRTVTGGLRLADWIASVFGIQSNFSGATGSAHIYAPVSPVPRAFMINVAIYGILCYFALSFTKCLSGFSRRMTNRCHPCGYRLDGLTGDTCPECGWVIKRAGRAGATAEEGGAGA